MSIPRWLNIAAERIIDEVTTKVEWRNHKLVSPTSEHIADIIRELAPFKFDVAYMPVPRCDQCKHWQQFELENVGKCLEADRAILFNASKCGLETKDDFGCVAWGAK